MVVFNSDGETISGRSCASDPLESEDSAGFADAILPVSVSSDFMFLLKCLAVAVPAAYLLAWMFNPAWGML